MRIDRLGLALRARRPWESIDLGIALARRHVGLWFGPWWLAGGLLAAVLLGVGHATGWVVAVPWVFWWLKPALDRLPLFVLSRAVFGHAPGRTEVWRAALGWGWGPTLRRLLWLRFDPFRGLSLPADLLEGLSPEERLQRRALLRREGAGEAVALWFVMPWFEAALIIGLWSLLALMIPVEWWQARGGEWFDWLSKSDDAHALLDLAQAVLFCLVILVIEPFYVAAGFGLYLGRRVHLEAWDLELAFKRMAARAEALRPGGRALAVMLCALLLAGVGEPVMAAEGAKSGKPAAPAEARPKPARDTGEPRLPPVALPAAFDTAPAADRERLARALLDSTEHPTMGGSETRQRWRLKPDLLPDETEDTPSRFDFGRLLGLRLGEAAGLVLEALLWVLVAAGFAWLLWRFRDWLPWRREDRAARQEPPALRHRRLAPEEVAAAPELLRAARAAWQRGQARDAFACLYRAGLQEVSARRPRPLPPGTTEGELLRAAKALAHAPAGQHVQRLVRAWQAVAYAGAKPEAEAFEALIAAWPAAFGEAAA